MALRFIGSERDITDGTGAFRRIPVSRSVEADFRTGRPVRPGDVLAYDGGHWLSRARAGDTVTGIVTEVHRRLSVGVDDCLWRYADIRDSNRFMNYIYEGTIVFSGPVTIDAAAIDLVNQGAGRPSR
jgi:hypothetical protein